MQRSEPPPPKKKRRKGKKEKRARKKLSAVKEINFLHLINFVFLLLSFKNWNKKNYFFQFCNSWVLLAFVSVITCGKKIDYGLCFYLLLPAATCFFFHTRDCVPKNQLLWKQFFFLFVLKSYFIEIFLFFSFCSAVLMSDELLTGAGLFPPVSKWTIEKPRLSWPYIQYNWIYRLIICHSGSLLRFFKMLRHSQRLWWDSVGLVEVLRNSHRFLITCF